MGFCQRPTNATKGLKPKFHESLSSSDSSDSSDSCVLWSILTLAHQLNIKSVDVSSIRERRLPSWGTPEFLCNKQTKTCAFGHKKYKRCKWEACDCKTTIICRASSYTDVAWCGLWILLNIANHCSTNKLIQIGQIIYDYNYIWLYNIYMTFTLWWTNIAMENHHS